MLTTEEIQKYISEDKFSEKKRLARKGQDYYEGKHDIKNYRLFYYDSNGILKEDKYRSNVKIPHPFFTELVDQAVQYIFSGEQFAKSELPELQVKLDEYFNYNENFTAEISELLRARRISFSFSAQTPWAWLRYAKIIPILHRSM